jgi:hypothetical protein
MPSNIKTNIVLQFIMVIYGTYLSTIAEKDGAMTVTFQGAHQL